MPRSWCFLCWALLAAAMAAGPPTSAQPPAESPAVPLESPAPADQDEAIEGVREVGPPIFYAWDEKTKRYKAILGTTLEDLQKLEALRDKPADAAKPQRFHFAETGATVAGSADAKRADLTLKCEIVAEDEDWIAVPLRLGGAVLQSAAFTGPGSHFIDYDDDSGHVAWIRSGASEAKYQLELKLLVPLVQVGEETRLDLKLPRINPSKLSLVVATPKAQGAVSSGAQITGTTAEGEGTRFEVQASTSDLRLAWQGAGQPTSVQRPSVFDAVGKILVRVESQTRITWDATFTITVQQGEVSTVSVRLPPGATLITDEPAIRPSISEEAGGRKPQPQWIDIDFDRPLAKGASRDVRLACERLIPPRGEPKLSGIEIGGFDVRDAAQQRGHIGLVVGDAWRCDATPGNNVVHDDALPEGFREAGVLGSDLFRYVSRPHGVTIDISPRRKKLTLTPTYLFDVQPGRVLLDAHLRYQVLGARTDSCRVDLPGWEIEAVELVQPTSPETREPIDFDPFATEPLAINLPRTMRGEFEVRIRARHELPVDAIDFAVALPRPAADERQPALVVVQAANNIELRHQPGESRGLILSDVPSPVQLAPRQQSPLVFVERLDELDATLAAEFEVRTREISVVSLTQVELGEASTSTVQRLEYNVRYEPLRRLQFAAPAWLVQHESLQLSLDGAALPRSALSFASAGDAAPAGEMLLEVELPQPMIGAFTLEARHAVAMSRLKPGVASALTVTILPPRDEPLALRQNRVEVRSEPHLGVALADQGWQPREMPAPPGSPLVFETSTAASRLELVTTLNEARPRRTTVVEKLWLQSWIAGQERRERAVFELRTNDVQARIDCPTTMPRDQLLLVVDGAEFAPRFDGGRTLVVDLPGAAAGADAARLRRHVVELCWPHAGETDPARLHLAPPAIREAWVRQAYWHVVLPPGRISLGTPRGMAAESVWSTWGWPRPRLTQRELETWSGATAQQPPAAAWLVGGPQQFLYSSIGPPGEVQLATHHVGLSMLGLACVGLAMVLALVLVPASRHPAALLAAGAGLLALALWWPTLAVLAAQSLAIVIALVIGARLLEHWLWRRRWAQRPLGTMSAAPIVARRRRPADSLSAEGLSRPSTTATAALALPLAAPEAKP